MTGAGGISRTQPRPNPTSRGVGCQPPPQQRGPQHPPPQPASAQPGRKPERTKKGEAAGDAERFPQPARTKGPPPVGDTTLAHLPVTHRGWHRAGWWPQQTVHHPPPPPPVCTRGEQPPPHLSFTPRNHGSSRSWRRAGSLWSYFKFPSSPPPPSRPSPAWDAPDWLFYLLLQMC